MTGRRKRLRLAIDAQLGLAWYTREGWKRLCELADDRDTLDDTFEDWERGALAAVRDLESGGRQIRKVTIDVDALVVWCRERHCRVDSAARAEYVTYLLQQGKSL
jgi:hypothetical protein